MTESDPVLVLKRQLACELCRLIEPVGQVIAATTLDVDQPTICRLRHGQVERISLDRLIRLLDRLGRRVSLTVSGGPPVRFRYTPHGYLGRLAPRLGPHPLVEPSVARGAGG